MLSANQKGSSLIYHQHESNKEQTLQKFDFMKSCNKVIPWIVTRSHWLSWAAALDHIDVIDKFMTKGPAINVGCVQKNTRFSTYRSNFNGRTCNKQRRDYELFFIYLIKDVITNPKSWELSCPLIGYNQYGCLINIWWVFHEYKPGMFAGTNAYHFSRNLCLTNHSTSVR